MPAIFVYGSLKSPKTFQSVTGIHIPDTIPATTCGKMVMYEKFPIAFPDGEAVIHGLLFELPYELIQAIDTFEEEGRLCIRKEIVAKTEFGEEKAFIYWGNPAHPAFYDVKQYPVVEDGLWEEAEKLEYTIK